MQTRVHVYIKALYLHAHDGSLYYICRDRRDEDFNPEVGGHQTPHRDH